MLNILSGWQTANIKSFPVGKDADKNVSVFDQGEWAKFDTNGKLVKMEADSTGTDCVFDGSFAVFPVYAGNKRFYDTKYLGEVDVVTAKSGIIETDVMDPVLFTAGDPVYVCNGKVTNSATAGSSAKPIGYAIENSGANVAGRTVVKFALA